MSQTKEIKATEHAYSQDYTETYAIAVALGAAKDALATAQGLAHRGAHNPRRSYTRAAVDEARAALNTALRRLNEEVRVILADQHPDGRTEGRTDEPIRGLAREATRGALGASQHPRDCQVPAEQSADVRRACAGRWRALPGAARQRFVGWTRLDVVRREGEARCLSH
jgi:hypothetical protein